MDQDFLERRKRVVAEIGEELRPVPSVRRKIPLSESPYRLGLMFGVLLFAGKFLLGPDTALVEVATVGFGVVSAFCFGFGRVFALVGLWDYLMFGIWLNLGYITVLAPALLLTQVWPNA